MLYEYSSNDMQALGAQRILDEMAHLKLPGIFNP